MGTKLNTIFLLHPPRHSTLLFLRPTPVLSSSQTTKHSLSYSTLVYGPTLQKGHSPIQLNPEKLDETAFTRVFHLSALRVPAHLCSTLETRIRGHLLNWPCVKNIARVPNDEMDQKIKTLLPENLTEDNVALERRIYGKAEGDEDGIVKSSVLYRDELVKSFDSRGFREFANLAKISRPSGNGKWKRKGVGRSRDEVAVIEVVEEGGNEELEGLLGEGVGRWKWSGSTRLLLLDDKYRGLRSCPRRLRLFFCRVLFGDFCVVENVV